ncbi:MAG TPA: alpha/beta hydrolase [Candidatus Binatia bacterium]
MVAVALATTLRPARALDVPPDDSLQGASASASLALRLAALVPDDAADELPARVAAARSDCAALASASCDPATLARCTGSLAGLFDTVADVRAGKTDPLAVEYARVARNVLADALSRLAWARDAVRARRCDALAPSSEVPAHVLAIDGALLDVRPLRALRAGRRYALVAPGASQEDVAALRASLRRGRAARGGDAEAPVLVAPPVTPTLAEAGYERDFAGHALRFDDARARALLRRIAEQAENTDGLGSSPRLRLELPEPATGEALARLRLAFVPAASATPADTIATFRTRDVRAPWAARRARLASLVCADGEGRGVALEEAKVGLPGARAALVLRGRVPSLAVDADATTAEGGAKLDVPFLLALPADWSDATPVVLLVHGHGSRADAFLKTHAAGLVARGLAALALELPGHGERSGEPPFLDVLAPERLPTSIAQAAVDVLATIRLARGCGFRLPDGRSYRPSDVLYLGYSVGSVIGVLVRAVEPDLGTTVLLAPAGDLVDWPIVQMPKQLGAEVYKICRAGPKRGTPCPTDDVCGDPAACEIDPQVMLLWDALRFPYAHALAPVEPTAYATERTGAASDAPLLLIAGGKDQTLTDRMTGRLADAYGMKPTSGGGRRGPHARLVWWDDLGHELAADPRVKQQAYAFLASRGRRLADRPSSSGD